ncbi:MAG: ABC transporter ATP-binding protein [Clostridia bacterium]|nr:ABC transporter ATP-binding protein [Clostridia bacterium]
MTDISKAPLMLETKNLGFSYGDTKILKDINFRAYEGQLVALIGPNGAGKSTLFKCILKFLHGYEGQILIEGQDMAKMSRPQIAKKIAYIPQTSVPVFDYKVLDIVLMGLTGGLKPLETPKKKHVDRAKEVLEDMGISHLADRGYGRISGGERQLVLLARAIVQNAKILVMDEPTANLDYGNQFRVMEKIRELVDNGYTIIISTHNPEHALLFAEKAFVLQDGCVKAAGPSREVLTEKLMQELYDVEVRLLDTQFRGEEAKVCMPVRSTK